MIRTGKAVALAATIGFAAALLILTIGLSGCFLQPGEGGATTGFRLVVEPEENLKAITPPISMACASYAVEVLDSSSTVAIADTITENTEYLGLAPDTYTVNIIGYNDTSDAIGAGSNTVTVAAGTVADCSVVVEEYETSDGSLDVTASWTAHPDVVYNPSVQSELTFQNGTPADISADWTLGADLANLNKSLAVGNYALIMRLFDNGSQVAGFAEIARIAAGQTSTGIIYFDPNPATGGFQVLLSQDFHDTLDLTTDVPEGELWTWDAKGITTITTGGADLYSTFLQGSPLGSSSTVTVDPADWSVGDTAIYDQLGWSADGKNGGDLRWVVKKGSAPVDSLTIAWNEPTPFVFLKFEIFNETGLALKTYTGIQGGSPFIADTSEITEAIGIIKINCDSDGDTSYDLFKVWHEKTVRSEGDPVELSQPPERVFDFGDLFSAE